MQYERQRAILQKVAEGGTTGVRGWMRMYGNPGSPAAASTPVSPEKRRFDTALSTVRAGSSNVSGAAKPMQRTQDLQRHSNTFGTHVMEQPSRTPPAVLQATSGLARNDRSLRHSRLPYADRVVGKNLLMPPSPAEQSEAGGRRAAHGALGIEKRIEKNVAGRFAPGY